MLDEDLEEVQAQERYEQSVLIKKVLMGTWALELEKENTFLHLLCTIMRRKIR